MCKKIVIFLCIVFISSLIYAQVNWVKFPYFQNWGGLNDQLSTTEIQDNEATDLQNVTFDTGGAITKRFGYSTIPVTPEKIATGTTVAVTGLTFYKRDNGDRFLVGVANNDSKATLMKKDYQSGGGPVTGAWDNIDYAGLPSSYTNNDLADFAVARDTLVFTVGINTVKPFSWSGSGKASSLTGDSDCPNAEIVEYHKNHLFLSGNDANLSRVWFSELDSITSYISTDFFDVETSDGTQVRALLSAFDALYIFKDKSIWRLSGWERDTFRLEKMVDGIGTLSNNSVKIVNNLIYFVTNRNDIAIYDGNYTVQFISSKIRNTISGLNASRSSQALGLAFSSYKNNDYDYYCSLTNSGSTTNNRVLLFDTAYKAWTRFNGINANAWSVGEDSDGKNAIFFGDYSGYVHQYPSTTYYDGNVSTDAINAYYQTKWFRYPEVALGDKYWRLLKTYALSNDGVYLYAEVRSDYEASGKVISISLSGSGAKWDEAKWDVDLWGGASIIVGRNEINKSKNMFQVKFYNDNVNEGFTLVGWEMFIEGSERV